MKILFLISGLTLISLALIHILIKNCLNRSINKLKTKNNTDNYNSERQIYYKCPDI